MDNVSKTTKGLKCFTVSDKNGAKVHSHDCGIVKKVRNSGNDTHDPHSGPVNCESCKKIANAK